jgi:glyoxylase-like metal-dependent hydrolase (beta-lactamase superfamily II)
MTSDDNMTLLFPTSSVVRAPHWGADASQPFRLVDFPVRYGVAVHPSQGIVLIDTGYTRELFEAKGAALAAYRLVLRPRLDPALDPSAVLASLGAGEDDVRHIVVTHLHADHVSGLARFPRARIHASRASHTWWKAAPRLSDMSHAMFRKLLPPLSERVTSAFEDAPVRPLPWGGGAHDILGDGSLLTLDLPGHMLGHAGVVFPKRDVPIFYAVDTAWTRAGYRGPVVPPYPLRSIIHDMAGYHASNARVLAAEAWGARIVLCHDPEPVENVA